MTDHNGELRKLRKEISALRDEISDLRQKADGHRCGYGCNGSWCCGHAGHLHWHGCGGCWHLTTTYYPPLPSTVTVPVVSTTYPVKSYTTTTIGSSGYGNQYFTNGGSQLTAGGSD